MNYERCRSLAQPAPMSQSDPHRLPALIQFGFASQIEGLTVSCCCTQLGFFPFPSDNLYPDKTREFNIENYTLNTPPPNNQQPTTSNRVYWLAAVCSVAWFAFWLSAFRPVPEPAPQPKFRLPAAICPATDPALNTLQSPTLFALPSEQGFSGTFPADQVNVRLSLEQPRRSETYLSRQPTSTPTPDQTQLFENIPRSESELPAPGGNRTPVLRNPKPIAFFFSPELASRATGIKPPVEIESPSAASVRIHLTVRPDGTVAHAFFERPAEQAVLLISVRKLRFTPAPKETSGWLDIRFTLAKNPKP